MIISNLRMESPLLEIEHQSKVDLGTTQNQSPWSHGQWYGQPLEGRLMLDAAQALGRQSMVAWTKVDGAWRAARGLLGALLGL
jgi:hypothetical protein